MFFLQPLLFILPLGLDTLGVSLSLGIKSVSTESHVKNVFPLWLRSALLFALAETLMPLVGLLIGYAASSLLSTIMHYVGALLLIGIGCWELWGEVRERLEKQEIRLKTSPSLAVPAVPLPPVKKFAWRQQLLLALSVSLDELAIGFSLGSLTNAKLVSPLILCLLIGLQGFLMTVLGIVLGRTLRARLKPLTAWSELLSAFLLIGLGAWLLVT